MDETDWAERFERATELAAREHATAAERLYVAAQRYVRAFERRSLDVASPVLDHLDAEITFTAAWLQDAADRWGMAYGDWHGKAELKAA